MSFGLARRLVSCSEIRCINPTLLAQKSPLPLFQRGINRVQKKFAFLKGGTEVDLSQLQPGHRFAIY
jgi:hypothetical protein